MEIERKFLVRALPEDLETFLCLQIEQAYLCTDPVIRIRQSNDSFRLTVKSDGLLAREEFETDLTAEQYRQLSEKVSGIFIQKTRYLIPCPGDASLTIELDIFHGDLEGLIYAEVEFPSVEAANAFIPPSWFLREVTEDGSYTNAALSRLTPEELSDFLTRAGK